MKTLKQALLLITIILFSSCSGNSEEITLKLAHNVGDQQTIVAKTETNQGAIMSLTSETEVRFKVKSIDNNVFNFDSNLVRVTLETKMGDETESYDSSKDETQMTSDEKMMHDEFKPVLDAAFKISIDDNGHVVEPFSYANGQPLDAALIDMSNVQIPFPEESVSVGSTWKDERTNPITNQVTKSTYKLKDVSSSKITISVNSVISGISGLLGDNEVSGQYILDRTTCKLIEGSIEMNLQTGGKVTKTYVSK